tara:strand:- start:40059 stop:41753 length:1695 start_codon:yes stop_codon:yes gene_type:complete
MGRLLIFLIVLFIQNSIFSQVAYPQDYFEKPLEIPLILSGTFGELRSNHFHSGLDIKTQGREGLNVCAAAGGYVSRIKISHWGYGKALYITHPNGYTTVYGHLKKFSPKIEAYIKKRQYENESFEIQLFPKASELTVSKQEIVAFSGNSGGSGGPHLHFEIRNAKEYPMNPMLFGIQVPDSKSPQIRAAVVYSFGDSSHVNQSNSVKELNFKPQKDGSFIADKIEAYGTIGFGVNSVDRLDGALNNNGIFDLKMIVNGTTTYEHSLDEFSFSETRYLNTLIDYGRFYNKSQRIQKTFVEPANKLSIYKTLKNKGYLTVKDSASYMVQIIARDFSGNQTKLIIPVKGKKDSVYIREEIKTSSHFFKHGEFNRINAGKVTVAFPKNSFYNDLYFNFKQENEVAFLHDGSVPLHKNFTLTFDVSNHTKDEQGKLFIGRVNDKGTPYYTSTRRKDNKIYTLSRTLGNYAVFSDNQKPKVTPINFKNEQWLTKYRYLKVKISDDLSGIKSYRAEIDGSWILMEYDPKTNLLTYDFNDSELTGAQHTLKVEVVDNVNNSNTYIATFFKKH